jgi:pSer/pThr/pTyr-binding forkhead associated (FHA) protein
VPPHGVTVPPVPVGRETEGRQHRDRARLTYRDDQGPHEFVMRKDTVSVGRGGSAAWVDVQVIATAKVSREHLRIRMDASGQWFVQDVSLWGTTVDGVAIPPAVKGPEGVAQPGPEHPLPPRARIGLADAITIEFEAFGAP